MQKLRHQVLEAEVVRVEAEAIQKLLLQYSWFKKSFPELKKKKPQLHEIHSRLLWMLVIFLMNYQTNFMIFKMIRSHVMFFGKWHSLSSGLLCANPSHKYSNWLFEYYFHLPQHTSARAASQLLYLSKGNHEKLKMTWDWFHQTLTDKSQKLALRL